MWCLRVDKKITLPKRVLLYLSLRQKCRYVEYFRFAFSRIQAEYRDLLSSPKVGKCGPENSEYVHFSLSACLTL